MCHVVRTVTERSDQWQRAKPYGIMRVFRTSVLPFEPADAKRSTKCVAGSHSKGLPFEPADAKRSTKCVAGSHSKGLPFEPADAKRSTKYFLWSCLSLLGRSRVKNGSGNRYKQDPFQGTLQARIPRYASSVGRTDDEPGPGARSMEEKISPFRPHSFALYDSLISVYLTGYAPTGLMVGE